MRELDSQRFERPGIVDNRIRTGIDFNVRSGEGVTAAGAFNLLTALDVSGAFQVRHQILLGNILARANLFRRGVNTGRAGEDFTFQKIVDAGGENDPIVSEDTDDDRGDENGGNNNVWTQEKSQQTSKKTWGRFFDVTNDARRRDATAPNHWGDEIVWWTPNCHENRRRSGSGATPLSQMLTAYTQGVYHSINSRPASDLTYR